MLLREDAGELLLCTGGCLQFLCDIEALPQDDGSSDPCEGDSELEEGGELGDGAGEDDVVCFTVLRIPADRLRPLAHEGNVGNAECMDDARDGINLLSRRVEPREAAVRQEECEGEQREAAAGADVEDAGWLSRWLVGLLEEWQVHHCQRIHHISYPAILFRAERREVELGIFCQEDPHEIPQALFLDWIENHTPIFHFQLFIINYDENMPHGQRIAELLLDIGAVKLSLDPPFTWTSGIKAPIYCDNRMIYSHPDAREFVVNAIAQRVQHLHVEPDIVAGTATAAIGWAALVADRLHLPLVYVRSKAKEHGTKKRIEGDLPPEKDVVLIEDLLSTGGSAVSSVEALREEGKARVCDVVAIFSYELASSLEKAQEYGVHFHPLSSLTTLLQVALGQGLLIEKEVKRIAAFASDPDHWTAT